MMSSKPRYLESILHALFFACAAISVVTTIAVIVILAVETWKFLQQVPLVEFLFGTNWSPMVNPKSYGLLPLISGTMLIVVGASLIALPIGVASAVYLSEYASERARNILKPVLEVLAGIPTVVYGFLH